MQLHNHLVYVRETMKAQEVLIFDIGVTDQLDVGDTDISGFNKQEELNVVDDASSNQTFTEAGPMSGPGDRLNFFRCKPLNLSKLVTSKQHLASFRKYIHFKYVFLVGGTQAIFDSQVMNRFLQSLIQCQMKPFSVYLVRSTSTKEQVERGPYKHLLLPTL